MNSTAASRMEQCNGQQTECAAVEDQPAETSHRADAELIRRFVDQQDEAAFRQIVHRYTPLVMSVALRTTRDRQAAEDVLQATFLVLVEKAESLDDPTQISAWLHGVAMRIARRLVDKRHRHKEQPHRHENLVMDPAVATDPFEQVCQTRDHDVLGEELQRLPAKFRTPMVLRYLEDLTNEQVAERLGLSVPAVEGRLKRGKKELRRRLARRGVTLGAAMLVWNMTQQSVAAAPVANLADLTATTALAWQSPTPVLSPPTAGAMSLAQQEMLAMSTLKLTTAGTLAGTILLTAGLLVTMSGADVGPAPQAAAARATSTSLPIDTSVNSGADVTVALAQSDDTAAEEEVIDTDITATDEARTDSSSTGEATSIEEESLPADEGPDQFVQVFPLRHVDAELAQRMLTGFFVSGKFGSHRPVLQADVADNRVIVRGEQDVQELAEVILRKLDELAEQDLIDTEITATDEARTAASSSGDSTSIEDVASTDATDVPTEFLDTGQVDVAVTAVEDGTTDTEASEPDVVHDVEEVGSYVLKTVDAEAMLRVLDALYPGASTQGHETGLSVAADADKNRLIVRGTPQQNEQIRKLLIAIDGPEQQMGPVLKDIAGQLANKEITFEKPDGVIRKVDNSNYTVWLNLGEADGIRPQLSFGVYDQDHDGGPRNVADSMGSIEIVRVLGPHLAEARISEARFVNGQTGLPVKPGDVVYSPLWTPGQNDLSQAPADGTADTEPAEEATEPAKEVKFFTLQNASAESVVQTLKELVKSADGHLAGVGDATPPAFSFDARTNSVLAYGDPDYLRVIEAILLRIDEPPASDGAATATEAPEEVPEDASEVAGNAETPEPTPESAEPSREVRVFKLQVGQAREAVEVVNDYFARAAGSNASTAKHQQPDVGFDARTNSLIAEGSPGQLALIEAWVTPWDVPDERRDDHILTLTDMDIPPETDAKSGKAQYVLLKHADARQIARLIVEGFALAPLATNATPSVSVDERNNMLKIRGTVPQTNLIRRMAEYLDYPRPEDQDSPSAAYLRDDVQYFPEPVESVAQESPDSAAAPTGDASPRQQAPGDYQLGPGDVLGVYIETVLGNPDKGPPVHYPQEGGAPVTGYPVPVREDGTLALPLISPIDIAGLTVVEATERIRKAYTKDRAILPQGKEKILLTLIKRGSHASVTQRGEDRGYDDVQRSLSRFDITHRSPAGQKLKRALREPTSLKAEGKAFTDILKELADRHEIEVHIDWPVLGNADAFDDEEWFEMIPVKFTNDVPLSTALDRLLRNVPSGVESDANAWSDFNSTSVTYFIQDDVLVVTTREVAEQTMQTRTYDLRPFQARGRSNYRDSIVEAIRTMTGESTWDDQGGRGTLVEAFGTLTIRQSPLVHREIEALLQQLLHAAEATAEPAEP